MSEKDIQKALQDNSLLRELIEIAVEFQGDREAIQMAIQCLKGTEKVQ